MTSPYAFYQFWVNADDRDVGRYLRYFSFRSREEIEELEKETAERPAARRAQRALAEELTTLVHGEEETPQAVAASQALFGRGSLDDLAAGDAAGRADRGRPGAASPASCPTWPALLQGVGPGAEPEGGPPGDRRGRRVRQQRPGHRRRRHGRPADLLHGRYLVLRRGKRSFAGVELRRLAAYVDECDAGRARRI